MKDKILDLSLNTVPMGACIHYILFLTLPHFIQSRDMKFIHKQLELSCVQSIEYAVALASAINVLHAKRIAHRDIKSANIMVSDCFASKASDI